MMRLSTVEGTVPSRTLKTFMFCLNLAQFYKFAGRSVDGARMRGVTCAAFMSLQATTSRT